LTEENQREKDLKVTVTEEKAWRRILDIEVSREKVDDEFDAVFEKYKTYSKIPGFRKGKAPMELIQLRFKDAMEKEVVESLVPKAYEDAVKEANLSPISLPVVKDLQFQKGMPLKFKAEIDVKPEIEVKDYKGIQLIKRIKPITEEDIEKSINYLREDFAELHPVEREAKFYDHLIVDLVKHQEGKEDKLENQQLFLDPHNMIKEFQESLIKAKAGDEKEIEVNYNPDFHNKKLAGKNVKYSIKVKQIKEKVLPEANDDFAKMVGGYKDLTELKSKITEDLTKRAMQDAEKNLRNDMINRVIKLNFFEVPETVLNFYLDSLIQDLKNKYRKVDEAKIREEYKEIGAAHIRWDYLLHQIAEKEKIEVSKDDIEEWTKKFAKDYKMEKEKAKELLETPQNAKRIGENILEEKVVDFLLKNAVIKEESFLSELGPYGPESGKA
jgi:trigger factor